MKASLVLCVLQINITSAYYLVMVNFLKKRSMRILVTIIFCVAFQLIISSPALAGTEHNVSGYAWSDNIGWISFNNTSDGSIYNYGVAVDVTNRFVNGTGLFSGYAWSDNIGWISFNTVNLSGCPSGACSAQIDWSTGKVTGWAKALAADNNGWDGWISLSGDGTYPYGAVVDRVTGAFSGFVWGSDVVGWIDMTGVSVILSPLSNLVSQNDVSGTGTDFMENDPITFSGKIINSSTVSIDEAGWAGLEIDWYSDGGPNADSSTGYDNYYDVTNGAKLGSFAPWQIKDVSYFMSGGVAPVGVHRYRFNADSTNMLAETDEDNRSVWQTFTVHGIPIGSLSSSACVIADGDYTCSATVYWNTTYVTDGSLIEDLVPIVNSGINGDASIVVTLSRTSKNYKLYSDPSATGALLSSSDFAAVCDVGLSWNVVEGVCRPAPAASDVNLNADPSYIRSGQTADINVEVTTANSDLVCNLVGVTLAPITITPVADGVVHTYSYTTRPLFSTQLVELSCSSPSFPDIAPVTTSIRVEVLPEIQEI